MRSSQGQSAVTAQVSRMIHSSSDQVRSQFEAQRASMTAHQKALINQAHQDGAGGVLNKSQERHLSQVQDNTIQQAHDLRMDNREDLSKAYQHQESSTQQEIKASEADLANRQAKQKKDYVDNDRGFKEGRYE